MVDKVATLHEAPEMPLIKKKTYPNILNSSFIHALEHKKKHVGL